MRAGLGLSVQINHQAGTDLWIGLFFGPEWGWGGPSLDLLLIKESLFSLSGFVINLLGNLMGMRGAGLCSDSVHDVNSSSDE